MESLQSTLSPAWNIVIELHIILLWVEAWLCPLGAPNEAECLFCKCLAVSARQVCAASGLLAVAHEKGEVRLYQFSEAARGVTCVHLSAAPPAECASGALSNIKHTSVLGLTRAHSSCWRHMGTPLHLLSACAGPGRQRYTQDHGRGG